MKKLVAVFVLSFVAVGVWADANLGSLGGSYGNGSGNATVRINGNAVNRGGTVYYNGGITIRIYGSYTGGLFNAGNDMWTDAWTSGPPPYMVDYYNAHGAGSFDRTFGAPAGNFTVWMRIRYAIVGINPTDVASGSWSVVKDESGPSFSLTANSTSWQASNASFRVSSLSDSGSGIPSGALSYSFDNVNFVSMNENADYGVSEEGTTTVYVRARDALGNVSSQSIAVHVDKTAPTLSATVAPFANATLALSAISLSDALSGPNSSSYATWFDSSTPPPAPSALTVTNAAASVNVAGLSAGAHTIYLRASDNVGNLKTVSYPFTIDRTGPTISGSIASYSKLTLAGTGFSLSDAGVGPAASSWKYSFDASPPANDLAVNSGSFDVSTASLLAEGGHTVNVLALDLLGNSSLRSFAFSVDRTWPTIQANVPAAASASLVATSVSLTDSASGVDSSTLRAWFDSATPVSPQSLSVSGASFVVSTADLAAGAHTLYVQVSDLVGNVRTASWPFSVDRTGPVWTATLAMYGSSVLNGSGATIVDAASPVDTTSPAFWFDSPTAPANPSPLSIDAFGRFSVAIPVSLSEGPHKLFLRAADSLGNVTTIERPWILDRTPPSFSGVFPTSVSSAFHVTAVTLTDSASGVDPASWKYWFDADWAPANAESFVVDASQNVVLTVPANLADGAHTVSLQASDFAGNVSVVTRSFDLDRRGPAIDATVASFARDELVVRDVSVVDAGQGVLPSSFAYRIDTRSPIAFSLDSGNSWTIDVSSLSPGSHVLKLTASDRLGNSSTWEKAFVVDRTGPVLSANVQAASVRSDVRLTTLTVTDSGVGADVSSVRYRWEGVTEDRPIPAGDGLLIPLAAELGDGNRTLTLTATDRLGNASSVYLSIVVDRTAPSIDATVAGFVRDTLTVTNVSIVDALSSVAGSATVYSFDSPNAATQPLPFPATLDVASLAQGSHSLWIGASDALGNASVREFAFVVDRTPPSVELVELSNADGILEPNDLSSTTSVTLTAIAGDRAASEVGNVASLKYRKSTGALSPSDLSTFDSKWIAFSAQTPTALTLANGWNYLYVVAFDSAGNVSLPALRQIRVDNGVPDESSFAVEGWTHPRAQSAFDAVANSEARFKISATPPATLKDFPWELRKGAVKIDEGILPWDGTSLLTLSDLVDNGVDEFYTLRVWARSVNLSRSASPIEYVFRVDTAAPAELRVDSPSHPNPAHFEANDRATLVWNEPLDMTGIRFSAYRLLDEPMALPTSQSEAKSIDLGLWTRASTRSTTLNLAIDGKSFGKKYFVLCVEDFAGNRQFAQREVKFDVGKPTWEASSTGVGVRLGSPIVHGFAQAIVEWGNVTDDREVSSILVDLQVSKNGGFVKAANTAVFSPLVRSCVFEELDATAVYWVNVRAQDPSGNERSVQTLFVLDPNVTPPTSAVVPFSQTWDAWAFRGQRDSVDFTVRDALAVGPDAAFVLSNSPLPSRSIALDPASFVWNAQGEWESARSVENAVTLAIVAGRSYSIDAVAWSKSWGVELRALRVQILGLTATFPWVRLSSGTSAFVVDSAAVDLPEPREFETSRSSSENVRLRSWTVGGVSSVKFETNGLQAIQGTISSTVFPSGTSVESRIGSVVRPYLSARRISLDPQGNLVYAAGQSSQSDVLVLRGNRFVLKDFEWKNGRLFVYEAKLDFDTGSGSAQPSVFVRNFSIDAAGELATELGFEIDSTDFSRAGFQYNASAFSLDSTGVLSMSGSVTVAGNTYVFDRLTLSSSGPKFDAEVPVRPFQATAHGFSLQIERASWIDEGTLWVERARIVDFPAAFGGGSPVLTSFRLDAARRTVESEGSSTYSATVTSASYSGAISIAGLIVDSTGLRAQGTAALSAPFVGSASLNRLTLNADGSFGDNERAETAGWKVEGFETTVRGVRFSTDRWICESIELKSPLVVGASVSFSNVSVGGASIEGASALNVVVLWNAWSFDLPTLTLDASGVRGEAKVKLPIELGEAELTFAQWKLTNSTTVETGATAQTLSTRVYGYASTLSGIELKATELSVANAVVSLFPTMGAAALELGALRIAASGRVLSAGIGKRPVSFRSTNGFLVDATEYTLTDDGLSFTGRSYLPSGLGAAAIDFDELRMKLSSSGALLTERFGANVSFRFGELALRGNDVWFDLDGVYFSSTSVSIPALGIEFPIGGLAFYANGDILYQGQGFPGFATDALGCHFEVSKVSLEENGVAVRAYVTLPGELDHVSVYFDPLVFHPDGRITSDTEVSHLNFTIETAAFAFERIRFDGTGLSVGKATITLPASLESKQIRVSQLRIGSNGAFEIGSLSIDPVDIFGMTFYLDDLGFGNGQFDFKGRLTLPQSLGPSLGGQVLEIADFRLSTETGELLAFNVRLPGQFDFPLGQGWTVVVRGIGVQKDETNGHFVVVVEQGSLLFPENLLPDGARIGAVSISGLKIDPVDAKLTFGQIAMEDFQFQAWGTSFSIDRASINQDFDFSLSGSVTLPSDDKVPAILRGKTLTLAQFQIFHDGTLGNVSASLDGLSGPLFDSLALVDGGISLTKETNVRFGVRGKLQFGGTFPEGIRGTSIDIRRFEIDFTTGEITQLDAGVSGLSFDVFGAFRVESAAVAVAKTQSGFDVSVSGAIVLPSSLPGVLANQRLTIQTFRIGTDGVVKDWAANLTLAGANELFSGVQLKDASVGARLVHSAGGDDYVFQVAGDLLLGPSFPQGLAGAICSIQDLTFSANGGIQSFQAAVQLSDFQLFQTLTIKRPALTFQKIPTANDLSIGVSGSVVLPPTFPQGLAGLEIAIRQFRMNTSGQIEALDVSTSGINLKILNQVDLVGGAISVVNRGNSEFVFTTSGTLVMPATLPQGLKNSRLDLFLKVSTVSGVQDFSASLGTTISFDVFAGIQAKVTKLALNSSGFSVAGSMTFPSNFPIEISSIVLNNLQIGWDGKLVDISAGIGLANLKVGGFSAAIRNLIFHTDGITLGSCIVTLPSPLNRYPFGIANAGVKWDGTFYGSAVLPSISADIGGFQLYFNDPVLDPAHRAVSFSKVGMTLPPMLKNVDFNLTGVKISPNGLEFTGGSFRLPDFTAGPGLGFRNMAASFSLNNGQYRIDATGEASIPGAGTFSAEVSFVNVSSVYPIGLKNAVFTYRVFGLGLPLASTGLYLNEITGGLAFGPPDELPAEVRWLFGNGTRIRLGVGVQDQTGGKVVRASVNMWIDVTNVGIVFKGNVTVLNGLADAEVIAAISKRGFYGKVAVRLVFVRGQVEVWVWGEGGTTRVAGSGYLQIGLPKASIVNIPTIFGPIEIPTSDWWGPSVGAAFGQFSNGREGVKGWIDFSPFGQLGVFAPKGGGIEFVNVGDYTLVVPTASGAGLGPNASSRSLASAQAVPAPRGRAVYRFDSSELLRKKGYLSPSSSRPNVRNGNSRQLEGASLRQTATASVGSLVFVLGIGEGDPRLTAISPSGIRYTKDSENVEVSYPPFGQMFVVRNPEPGEWQVELENAPNPEMVKVAVLGVVAAPEVSVETPEQLHERTGKTYRVAGRAQSAIGQTVTVYLSNERDTFVGPAVANAVVAADGTWEATIEADRWAPSEYFVFAGVQTADAPEKRAYAAGTIVVPAGLSPMVPVTAIRTALDGADAFRLWFDDPNSQAVEGFRLSIENRTKGGVEELDMGYLTQIRLSGYERGDRLSLSIRPYDRDRHLGPEATAEISFLPPEIVPTFSWTNVPSRVSIASSGRTEVSVRLSAAASTPVRFAVTDSVEGLTVVVPQDVRTAPSSGLEIPIALSSSSSLGAGRYTVKVAAVSALNPSVVALASIEVDVVYPAVKVFRVEPSTWAKSQTPEVTVFGENFLPGTRAFFGDKEIALNVRQDGLLQWTADSDVGGPTTLTVRGPGGDEASVGIVVVEPRYRVRGILTEAKARAGQDVRLSWTVDALDGFASEARFAVEGLASNWSAEVSPQAISDKLVATATVRVPATAPVGRTTFFAVSDRGDRLELVVDVVEDAVTPFVARVGAPSAWPGETAIVYGYGFTETPGTIRIGSVSAEVLSWSNNEVKFVVPLEGSGPIELTVGSTIVTGPSFWVRKLGFNVYSERSSWIARAGESLTIPILVRGFSPSVLLSVAESTGTLDASLDVASVVPNAQARLTVRVPSNASAGRYTLVVQGQTGNVRSYATVFVDLDSQIEIATRSLPQAMVSAPYAWTLEARNAAAPVRWQIDSGELPLGIQLRGDGKLEGVAIEEGESVFTVRATDRDGRTATSRFSLRTELNVWAIDGGNSGSTRFQSTESPATDRTKWNQTFSSPVRSILTGKARVYVRTASGITALDEATGRMVFDVRADVVRTHWTAGTLLILDRTGELTAYDGLYGGIKWTRSGVKQYYDAQSHLVVVSDEIASVDPSTGELLAVRPWTVGVSDRIFQSGTTVRRLLGNEVQEWAADRWVTVRASDVEYRGAASDERGYAVWDDITLTLVETEGANGVEHGLTEPISLALGDRWIAICSNDETYVYARSDLSRTFRLPLGGRLVLAHDRLFVHSNSKLAAYNLHSGAEIWSSGASVDGVLSGTKYYAAIGTQNVAAFDGPNDASGPTTELLVAAPDGDDGWYRTRPTIRFRATDPDTRVERTYYRFDSNPWTIADSEIDVPEGDSVVEWFSVDEEGWKEHPQIRGFRVDTGAPILARTLEGQTGRSPWYVSPVRVVGQASDSVSQVRSQEFIVGSAAIGSGAQAVLNEGEWTVEHRAVDFAGNRSAASFTVSVDLTDPIVVAEASTGSGWGSVRLTVRPGASPLESLKYRIDSGPWTKYEKPIGVPEGLHTVESVATSISGRVSAVVKTTVDVSSLGSAEWVERLYVASPWDGQSVVRNVRGGEYAYVGRARGEKLPPLPAELVASDYLRLNANDGRSGYEDLVQFRSGIDTVVYVARSSSSSVPFPAGFALDRSISFPGRTVAKKFFVEGSDVRINGPALRGNATPDWIFVQKAKTNSVQMIVATPRDEYHPGDGIEAYVVGGPLELSRIRWTIAWNSNEPLIVSNAIEARLVVPFFERTAVGILTLTADVGASTVVREYRIEVKNRARVRIEIPSDGIRYGFGWDHGHRDYRPWATRETWDWFEDSGGWKTQLWSCTPFDREPLFHRWKTSGRVLGGAVWNPFPRAWNVDGLEIQTPAIEWTWSSDAENWNAVERRGDRIVVPVHRGKWLLRAKLELGNGNVQTSIWKLESFDAIDRSIVGAQEAEGAYWTKSADATYRVQLGTGKYRIDVRSANGREKIKLIVDGVERECKRDWFGSYVVVEVRTAVEVKPIGNWTAIEFNRVGEVKP